VIVNETLDVDDGGVSGVLLGGVAELVPGDTPRGVERPASRRCRAALAERLLAIVYGAEPDWPAGPAPGGDQRPPRPVGYRGGRSVVWEVEDVAGGRTVAGAVTWPNALSRLVGDKTFGLLVAHLLGQPGAGDARRPARPAAVPLRRADRW
jgi:hypothetical protein